MSVISIETRKANELAATSNISDSSIFMVHDGTGLKRITFEDVKRAMVYPNAGSHNTIYRGKNLGSAVTQAQYTAIKNGTFENLFIGDYWVMEGNNYRIAAFDYFYNTGDNACTSHHIVIVPDNPLYNYKMNDTDTTVGGYVGSKLYRYGLDNAKSKIRNLFSGHILIHRLFLFNTVTNNLATSGSQFDSEVNLLSEIMVYGTNIFSPLIYGTNIKPGYYNAKTILPLFHHNPLHIASNRNSYWLRDVTSNDSFASVYQYGNPSSNGASLEFGIRPFFCIS